MPAFLKTHWPALLSAVLFGIIIAGIFFFIDARLSFRAPFPEFANDQNFYLSRIQDAREGYAASGNTYIEEDQFNVPMQFLTGEIIEGGILNFFNIPTDYAPVIFSLIFAPFIFLLTYAIFLETKAPPLWALLGTIYLCAGIFFTELTRPISPQFNFILWLVAVWWLFKIDVKSLLVWFLGEAVFVGALIFVYPYYWTHLFVTLALIGVYALFVKRWGLFGASMGAIAGAAVLGIPYILLALSARALPYFAESMTRLGFIATHIPSGFSTLFMYGTGLVAIVVLLFRLKRFSKEIMITLALLAAGCIAMNQHIVTGINMEFSSHYQMQIAFAFWFLISAFLGTIGWWPGKKLTYGIASVIGLTAVLAIGGAYLHASTLIKDPVQTQYVELLGWLKEHGKPDESVYAPEPIALFIPAYTELDVFYARNANIALMPDSEVRDRFIIENYNADFSPEFVAAHEREIFGHGYINANSHALEAQKLLSLVGITIPIPERIPKSAVSALQARAAELKKMGFKFAVGPHHAHYFIVDTEDPNALTDAQLSFAHLAFATPRFKLYVRE